MLDRADGDPAEALRASPTSACTPRRTAGAPRRAARARDVLLKVLAERNPDSASTSTASPALAEHDPPRARHDRRAATPCGRRPTLHDVGKVAIPDAILDKPGPLDEDEWAFMRRHTIIGERILHAAPALAAAAPLVRSRHERFDGTGYPDGLAGDDIPLGARIIAVCDAYDAMISDRPYRARDAQRGGARGAAPLRRHAVRPRGRRRLRRHGRAGGARAAA